MNGEMLAKGQLDDSISKKFSEKERRKVDVIVRAAATLFDRNGYIETSLRDISTEAGLSKGGIYHYFSSKHEILFYVLDGYVDLLLDGIEDELTNIDSPADKIKYLVNRHLELYIEHVPEVRALLNHARALPPREFRHITTKQKRYAKILSDILGQMTSGKTDPVKLTAVSYFIFGMYNSIMHWHDPDGPITLSEISEICYRLLMDGWHSLTDSELMA